MRIAAALFILIIPFAVKAQNFAPSNFGYMQRPQFARGIHLNDSIAPKKWFITRSSGISTSFSFFKGGNATVVSAPMGLQLNRRLNNNLYAFANITVAPSFVSFNSSYPVPGGVKANQNNKFNSNSFEMYSAASVGLTYVNDERTFSISGGISVERSSYPGAQYNQPNFTKPNTILPVNDDKRLH